MTARYQSVFFTRAVREAQDRAGSRAAYANYLARHADDAGQADSLNEKVAAFIAARDSFYMATINEDGWPYVQHRGGIPGFVRVLDGKTIGFADFRGNRQYISVGNISADNRVSLFFMDYVHRARLKLVGRARIVGSGDTLLAQLAVPGTTATVERGIVIEVEAFDWNCAQHILPRFTAGELRPELERLTARIAELEAELAGKPA
ncbi:pyridoxamine 5'-phosphate oxidase family protein [Roseibium sp.]|uniref:pyridoxamine 5'-phosphate oxidase family protein n=1 Tax=Roseibium sp. TaxID=1936156 RepID=UPI003D0F22D5